ncbi:helix-turn-helix domain-containing protein, partial [Klebsiella pneumoniae]|nr:helix-turn-helix domain-containing protein [Klebsiella pneumoniae]
RLVGSEMCIRDRNWDAVADQFSLSLRTLHRQLKQQTGLTPQRYLNRLRLMKARHLLRHSEASVTDIAYRCLLYTSPS